VDPVPLEIIAGSLASIEEGGRDCDRADVAVADDPGRA
jgi:hypothetical protein